MKVNLDGMLRMLRSRSIPQRNLVAHSAEELIENLKELREKYRAGEGPADAGCAEFFSIYVFDEDTAPRG